ncbi:replication-relaxation family protein [Ferdinandcohnia sp. SAFN-114]|uniref:replication-relaxation family protein n=1 Tax=Ferdinandcohnia sp. SAFN-114 TaxID=3387275 RepID=UPI003F8204F5
MAKRPKRKIIKIGEDDEIRLSDDEFLMLKLITESKFLSVDQIYSFISRSNKTNKKSLRDKLVRWASLDVLAVNPVYLGRNGVKVYYFRIGSKGIEILIKNGYAPKDWYDLRISDFFREKQQLHTIATQEMVTNTLILLDYNEQITSKPASSISLWNNEGNKIIIPDWIFSKDNHYLNIEIDTGSQEHDVLKDKITNYIQLAEKYPEQNHSVLFVVVDESLPVLEVKHKNRDKRVGNIKQTVIEQTEQLNIENLNLYVVSLYRAHGVAARVLLGETPLDTQQIGIEVTTIQKVLEYNNKFKDEYDVNTINGDSIYMYHTPSHLYADLILSVSNKAKTIQEKVFVVLLEEGYMTGLKKLHYLHSVMKSELREKVDKIIGVYKRKEEMEHDRLGELYPNLLVGVIGDLVEQMESEPKFYTMANKVRLEAVTFERTTYVDK